MESGRKMPSFEAQKKLEDTALKNHDLTPWCKMGRLQHSSGKAKKVHLRSQNLFEQYKAVYSRKRKLYFGL